MQTQRAPLIFLICCPFGTAAVEALAMPAALNGDLGHEQVSPAAVQGSGML